MSSEELIGQFETFRSIQVLEGREKSEVMVNGKSYMGWETGDETAKRMAIVQLHERGKGTQEEIAQAFHLHVNSVHNYISMFRKAGAEGLIGRASGPKEAWKITPEKKFKILEIAYRNRGISYEELGKELKRRWNEEVGITSIRNVLLENGFVAGEIRTEDVRAEQEKLFEDSELKLLYPVADNGRGGAEEKKAAELPREVGVEERLESSLRDKAKRHYSVAQRKYLDEIERSSSGYYVERGGKYSAYAGGLLLAPIIRRYKLMSMMRRVVAIDTHEGYSLEELSLTLLYFDIFGFCSVENFKTVYPEEFGILIGKTSSPSICTIRRFLHRVQELFIGERLMEEFAKGYLKSGLVKWGVLYIDEHFLPYHGMQMVTMGWFTVRNKPLKGGYNFMSVDEDYNPFIFLVRPSSEDLVEKIPEMIKKAKAIAKESGIIDDRLIVIFDREGYSAELFRELSNEKSESYARFISWAKYADTWVNEFKDEEFKNSVMVKYKIQGSDKIEYFETERQMSKYGKIRAIVIMSGRKKQRTAIYTNDNERSGDEIINLICTRWGQENVHKTLKENHYIDYFPGKGWYDSDEVEEQPMVGNHEIRMLKQERAALVGALNKLKVRIADKILSSNEKTIHWEEIKKQEIEMMSEIVVTESAITLINEKIGKLPKEIKYEEAHNGTKLYELDYEKKRFLDSIKIFSYHMQKQMCGMLLPYYDKKKEIWPAMRMIVNRGGSIRLEKGRLRVSLKSFRDPEIDFAARHLCDDLNEMGSVTLDKFHLPIRYEVV